MDPAQEPLTGVGLNFNLLSDELVGQGAWVIVASTAAALRQLTGPPAAKRRCLSRGGGSLCILRRCCGALGGFSAVTGSVREVAGGELRLSNRPA